MVAAVKTVGSCVADEVLAGDRLTVGQIAMALGVSPSCVWRLFAKRKLEGMKVAGRLLSSKAALKRYLDRNTLKPAQVEQPVVADQLPPRKRRDSKREAELKAVEAELARRGI